MKRMMQGAAIGVALIAVLLLCFPALPTQASAVGEQTLIQMKFIKNGVQSLGSGVLQTGEVNTLSAPVASATRAKVVSAPTSGSVYIRALLVETSTGAAGTVTVSVGTGTNCGSNTAVLLGPITNPPIGYIRLDVLATAARDVCLTTDANTTTARLLTN